MQVRKEILDEISQLQDEVNDYIGQQLSGQAQRNIYEWATHNSKTLQYISVDLMHTKVYDLLGFEDAPMDDNTCIFNGIQATVN